MNRRRILKYNFQSKKEQNVCLSVFFPTVLNIARCRNPFSLASFSQFCLCISCFPWPRPSTKKKKNPERDKITRTNSGVIISSCSLSDFRACVLKARDNKGMMLPSRPFWKTRSTRQLRLGRRRTPHRNLTTVPLSPCIPAACVGSQMISTDPTISLQANKNARLWWLEVNRLAKKTTCGERGSNGKLD